MNHMKAVWTGLALAAAVVLPGCEAAPVRAEPAGVHPIAWRELGAWSGDGSGQTESFDVTSGALRVRWDARAAGATGGVRLRVWLYSAISGRPLQLVVDQQGTGSGAAYAAEDPRVSYLVIEADRMAWTVRLDEAVRASP
jgi:hypothetical protein